MPDAPRHRRRAVGYPKSIKQVREEKEPAESPVAKAPPVTQVDPALLDIHGLAEALSVGRTTIENWTRSRRIPSLKMSRVLRYDLKKVLAALEAYERKAV